MIADGLEGREGCVAPSTTEKCSIFSLVSAIVREKQNCSAHFATRIRIWLLYSGSGVLSEGRVSFCSHQRRLVIFRVFECPKGAIVSCDSDGKLMAASQEASPTTRHERDQSWSLLEYATKLQNGRLVESTR